MTAGRDATLTLTLRYTPPYDWQGMIDFLAGRAIAGIETVESDRYRRTFEIDGRHGTVEVAPVPDEPALAATVRGAGPAPAGARIVARIEARVRRVFDLDAEVGAIAARLSRDVALAPLVAARPGLRVPGGWDGFELAIRAVLGQQISMAAARGLAGRLVAAHGEPLRLDAPGLPGLTAVFPRPERLTGVDFTSIAKPGAEMGMPRSRAATLAGLAARAAADPDLFAPDDDLERALARLRALPGIGEWTAQYIAMRALRHPDAFPASDLGLLRAAAVDGVRPRPAALLARAEAWRPWRAYAASYLWTCVDPGAGARTLTQKGNKPLRLSSKATDTE